MVEANVRGLGADAGLIRASVGPDLGAKVTHGDSRHGIFPLFTCIKAAPAHTTTVVTLSPHPINERRSNLRIK